jgi:hypothetical protein
VISCKERIWLHPQKGEQRWAPYNLPSVDPCCLTCSPQC